MPDRASLPRGDGRVARVLVSTSVIGLSFLGPARKPAQAVHFTVAEARMPHKGETRILVRIFGRNRRNPLG